LYTLKQTKNRKWHVFPIHEVTNRKLKCLTHYAKLILALLGMSSTMASIDKSILNP
jgi:hypothetical protein